MQITITETHARIAAYIGLLMLDIVACWGIAVALAG